ncbi:MAG: type II toxin-antitoxin system HicA family toxin [Desulfonatronovibrionaceae bacterium]
MPKLSPVSWKELVRRLSNMGFKGPFRGGKHPYMVRNDLVLTLPNPHRGDIGIDLLNRILKQAGISREEWLDS